MFVLSCFSLHKSLFHLPRQESSLQVEVGDAYGRLIHQDCGRQADALIDAQLPLCTRSWS